MTDILGIRVIELKGAEQMHLLVSFMVIAALAAPPAKALTLEASADTYTRGGIHAGTNYGTLDELPVQHGPGAEDFFVTYFYFDLSAYGATISNAHLAMTQTSPDAAGLPSYDMRVSVVDTAWTETTLTWGHFLGAGTKTFLGLWTVPASAGPGTTHTFSYDPVFLDLFLNSYAASWGGITFILESQTSNAGISFASREHSTYAGPTLTFDTTAVPVPASLPLAAGALGGMALLGRRRQRGKSSGGT